MPGDLEALLPARFLSILTFTRLDRLPRYLEAMRIRSDRARVNPDKDRDKSTRLQPYLEALVSWHSANLQHPNLRRLYEQLYWLIQEYKVSVFAQELGTAEPVSAKRLDDLHDQLRREAGMSE
jgi:ATP-dependent helicase HrpA